MESNYVNGLVSVIIPTYKRSALLERAIDSVLSQTYANIELLVVNDNTKNDEYSMVLYDLISSYDDKRLFLIEQAEHINGAAARNAGIKKSRGEFIAFLDDDDYFEKNKIALQVSEYSNLNKDYGMVGCMVRTYKNGNLIRASLPYRDGDILMDVMTRVTALGTGSVLIRRTVLDDVGFFDETLNRHQDLQLFAIICDKYKVKLVKKYLYNVDISDKSNRPQNIEQLLMIKERFFDSIKLVINKFTKKQKKVVQLTHSFELIPTYVKNGSIKRAAGIIMRIVLCPAAAKLVIKRSCSRKISEIFKYKIENKYE